MAELPTAPQVVGYLGQAETVHGLALAEAHLAAVVAQVAGYTRGRGFEVPGVVPDDLAAVVLTVAARTVGNPAALTRSEVSIEGDYSESTVFFPVAFTLAELAILNRYRRRTA